MILNSFLPATSNAAPSKFLCQYVNFLNVKIFFAGKGCTSVLDADCEFEFPVMQANEARKWFSYQVIPLSPQTDLDFASNRSVVATNICLIVEDICIMDDVSSVGKDRV